MPRKKSSTAKTKRLDESSKKESEEMKQIEDSVKVSISSRRGRQSRKRYVDTEEWVSRHLSELISLLGLEFLELNEDEYVVLLTRVVEMLRGESSTLDIDTIARRFRRNIEYIYPVIARTLLELRERLSVQQLEFVVNYIGDAVLGYAPRLYSEAIKLGRNDLVERLREIWRKWWVAKKHPILPVVCPVCGFNSLMPDMNCIICGSNISEKQLKEYINFGELLKEFAKSSDIESIKKALSYGYVYVNSLGIKAPSEHRDVLDIEVLLSNEEKELLRKYISQ
ncbi:conserved hypothetical protein [Ignisphaera aggregans DSM 17230]|uniref:Uncharacterized protein n=1 Tax=Ignisphaera aggregans (strain DSM 17230 / JCM 13409 / AQ1.S1) TaxID=583356 RepID=E0SP68_IGNAA|nr:conserved hypothetical protein [Ignisphaera aggregans DSM 17230]